ncbi:hypothetical protein MMC25_001348 [Agyrium rufum]|nr:hypothetical protein [Agyrium rufum]
MLLPPSSRKRDTPKRDQASRTASETPTSTPPSSMNGNPVRAPIHLANPPLLPPNPSNPSTSHPPQYTLQPTPPNSQSSNQPQPYQHLQHHHQPPPVLPPMQSHYPPQPLPSHQLPSQHYQHVLQPAPSVHSMQQPQQHQSQHPVPPPPQPPPPPSQYSQNLPPPIQLQHSIEVNGYPYRNHQPDVVEQPVVKPGPRKRKRMTSPGKSYRSYMVRAEEPAPPVTAELDPSDMPFDKDDLDEIAAAVQTAETRRRAKFAAQLKQYANERLEQRKAFEAALKRANRRVAEVEARHRETLMEHRAVLKERNEQIREKAEELKASGKASQGLLKMEPVSEAQENPLFAQLEAARQEIRQEQILRHQAEESHARELDRLRNEVHSHNQLTHRANGDSTLRAPEDQQPSTDDILEAIERKNQQHSSQTEELNQYTELKDELRRYVEMHAIALPSVIMDAKYEWSCADFATSLRELMRVHTKQENRLRWFERHPD